MRDFVELVVGCNEDIPLDIAVLELASIEFPDLEVEPWLGLLDSYATELSERIRPSDDGVSFISATNHYLFEELGFRGNDDDYYSPLNSCLNQVLMERVGLPITLSLVYMEIARRLDRPVQGIGLPGHFLVEYNDGELQRYIAPFYAGRILEPDDCLSLASRITGLDLNGNLNALAPVSKRQMALRMLNNLRAAYLRRSSWQKALVVQNLLVDAHPEEATEYRQRGYLHLQMKHYQEAASDLHRYLSLSPDAKDKTDVEKRLQSLQRWKAGMN
ncbi:MAG: tetratricopeptide repeat protein [Acidobacteria bacterium]|nr:tetratricopeptide repeat protein [Acidobacteriota bacterium]